MYNCVLAGRNPITLKTVCGQASASAAIRRQRGLLNEHMCNLTSSGPTVNSCEHDSRIICYSVTP